jgi:collagen type I/II/III/V/XI/XXIV/XXVII alpha
MTTRLLYDDSSSSTISNVGSFQIAAGFGSGPTYQSFSSGSTAVTLTALSFDLFDAAGGFDGGTVTVSLYSNSGTSAGTSLTTLGTISDSSLSTSTTGSFVTMATSSTFTLAANTTYWVKLSSGLIGQGPQWLYTTAPVGTTGFASEEGTTVSTTNEMLMTITGDSLCFAAGARVLTSRGEVPVETLEEGDLVLGMRGGKFLPVRWIGRRDVDLRTHPDPDSINPVRVCADAFGPGQPHRDLILSPNHALYVDEHLIAARYLINGATIRQEQWDRVVYFHVELESHDVMLVDGMMAESFLDVGNRTAFSNGGEPVMLHPDFAKKIWDAEACAPDLPKGEELTQLRQRLLDRVMPLGHALTDDSDICVLAGKRRIRPIEVAEGFRFNLPKGTNIVQIESRRFRPNEMRADGDDSRLLGVGVLSLKLDDTHIALDDARLTAGWHPPEDGLRWTQGEATLQTQGARTLTLRLFRGQHYWIQADAAEGTHVAA